MPVERRTVPRTATTARRSSSGPWAVTLASPSETDALGQMIGRLLSGGETLALCGDLGAGKTALVRGIATGLGAPPQAVSSPTFVLVQVYQGRLPLVHADLYRLRSRAEAESIGLHDYLQGDTVAAIEWADKFPSELPADRLEITLHHTDPACRTARFMAHGSQAHRLLTAIRKGHRKASAAPATRTSSRRATTVRRRRP